VEIKIERALEDIKREISPQGMDLMLAVLRWADVWDVVHAGEVVPVNDNTIAALLTPFSGFGAPELWKSVAPALNTGIMNEVMKYITTPEKERGSMVESLLLFIAPNIAMLERGPDGFRRTFGILHDNLNRS